MCAFVVTMIDFHIGSMCVRVRVIVCCTSICELNLSAFEYLEMYVLIIASY